MHAVINWDSSCAVIFVYSVVSVYTPKHDYVIVSWSTSQGLPMKLNLVHLIVGCKSSY